MDIISWIFTGIAIGLLSDALIKIFGNKQDC